MKSGNPETNEYALNVWRLISVLETSKLSVSISSTSQGRSVTAVTPKQPMASGILDDPASVEFIKSEILKVQSGLWGSRLEHLYREKFKKVLPSTFMQELKFRPDITRVDEIMQGRFLLYAPKKQQVPYCIIT